MPRDTGVSTAVIAFSVTIGALALITPLALRLVLKPSSEAQALDKPPDGVRVVKRLDLDAQGLAQPGGCGVGEFKDGRLIAESIRSQLRTAGLRSVHVTVTTACWARLSGVARSEGELEQAIRAASHPWVHVVDYRALAVADGSAPADAVR